MNTTECPTSVTHSERCERLLIYLLPLSFCSLMLPTANPPFSFFVFADFVGAFRHFIHDLVSPTKARQGSFDDDDRNAETDVMTMAITPP